MNAAILTIGDEILWGTTVDTNSAWLSQNLSNLGIAVRQIISVGDEKKEIIKALDSLVGHFDFIFITGGLGPTNDDITKNTLNEYFKGTLKRFPEIEKQLKYYFEKRGVALLLRNESLAYLPDNCLPIPNSKGTAWGMWFQKDASQIISMPGVPTEMKSMMLESLIPQLKKQFSLPVICHLHAHTASIGESLLAEKLQGFEAQLPKNIKLAYLPHLGTVTLRLSIKGTVQNEVLRQLQEEKIKLEQAIGKHIFGYEETTFESAIGTILKEQNISIATAESCTGGFIAHRITSVAGSSDYYKGSIVAYSNAIKIKELQVSASSIESEGAVSEAVVAQMLNGVISKFETQMGIAVSGIAGPGGGTSEKPVGTVWIAVGNNSNQKIRKIHLPGNRLQVIKLTSIVALEMLRKLLLKL